MRFVFVAVMTLALSACDVVTGPSGNVAGSWRAPGIGHSGQYFDLSLAQDGDTVSGVACSSDGGYLLFEGVPVTGELPDLTFVMPSGARFTGTFEDDRDQIAGDLGPGQGHIPLRFTRTSDGRCTGAKPLP